MQSLRGLADTVKPDFWLMGEVIHGDYSRWVNERTLHSVTNYHLHKALYNAHNDHNYFEIAHTVKRQMDLGLGRDVRLYSFVDNHDVERIYTKLRNKAHYLPVHVLLYTLPGIPSIYYGSEFGIEGRKERGSDASIRPYLDLAEMTAQENPCCEIVKALGRIHNNESALWYGDYRALQLTTTKYAFARGDIIVAVNNEEGNAAFDLPAAGTDTVYKGALGGKTVCAENGRVHIELQGNCGEIWIPQGGERQAYEPVKIKLQDNVQKESAVIQTPERTPGKPYEEMTVSELQAEILAKMAANGNVTDRMKQDVMENVYRDSLLNWVRSFR